MGKSKLKAALDARKGVDYKKLKAKKQQKEAEKKKRSSVPVEEVEVEDGIPEELSDDDEEGGVLIDEEAVGTKIGAHEEEQLQLELKALLGNKKLLMEIDSGSEVDEDDDSEDENEDEWESAAEDLDDEDEVNEDDDEDDEDSEDEPKYDLSRLEDSDSDDESDEDDDEEDLRVGKVNGASSHSNGVEEDSVDGEDIPLSEIESLASDERGDIIPHQRLTINNKAALKSAYDRIALPMSKLAFSLHQSITSKTNTAISITDIDDDLKRELAFYAQSLDAAKQARNLLAKEGVPFTRPNDYFAEMVKSDEHMGKVKDKLRDEAASKKASAEARRQRDLKKFGKQVQVAKMQERAKEKRETLDRINVLKRKRAGEMPSAENEPDLFDVSLEDAETTARKDREARRNRGPAGAKGAKGEPNAKRQKKNEKYGFGGKKRFSKSGDATSSADMRDHPGKRMKKPFKGGGGGAKARPGKARRAKARL